MKQYFAFYGNTYYPNGGMEDFVGDYDTKDEAIEAIKESHLKNRLDDEYWEYAWGHIWDSKDRIIVYTV